MDSSTLYYTLSTEAQVLAAMTAVLAAFIHFRIVKLQDYLVGDGSAVLERWGETGIQLEDFYRKRLRDGVARKNVFEIRAVLKKLSDVEKSEGHTRKERQFGLQYIFEDRFSSTESQISILKSSTLRVTRLAILTIIISLISIAFVDVIKCHLILATLCLAINIFLTICSLILSYKVIKTGFADNVLHETTDYES